MAAHSSILAWKIPWTEQSGRLQSMGLPRVGHDLATEPKCQMGKIPRRRARSPTPVFLPGESLGQSSLADCSPLGLPRVGHDLATEPKCQMGKIPRRRARSPTPVFLPGESYGQRSLVSCIPVGQKESDTTEVT